MKKNARQVGNTLRPLVRLWDMRADTLAKAAKLAHPNNSTLADDRDHMASVYHQCARELEQLHLDERQR